jgi:hypothetical protein
MFRIASRRLGRTTAASALVLALATAACSANTGTTPTMVGGRRNAAGQVRKRGGQRAAHRGRDRDPRQGLGATS